MTRLSKHYERYLEIRRGLGYDLSTPARVMRRFTAFADAQGAEYITTDLFLQWKQSFGSANQNTWAARLSMVRVFARWLVNVDPRTQVPPDNLIPRSTLRPKPYIYSDDEVAAIITAAGHLPSAYGLRGKTCAVLFGLIAVAGLRVSEALRLDNDHVDFDEGVLTVTPGKNGKSRFLPIAPETVEHLDRYRFERDRILRAKRIAFFRFETGRRPTDCGVRYNFAQACQNIGLRSPQHYKRHGRGPRIHDLRHSFAVKTIMNWYRQGRDPDREMIKLSTYLGHSNPKATYWYIEAVPELMKLASERAETAIARRNAR